MVILGNINPIVVCTVLCCALYTNNSSVVQDRPVGVGGLDVRSYKYRCVRLEQVLLESF